MSASLPGSSDPSRSAAPSAAAASSVTIRSACAVVTAVGLERRRPVQRRRQPQRHPHVEVVARDRPVGPERHPHPRRQHVRHPRDAARELEVRHRVVRHRSAGARQDRDLLVVEPDAMRQHRALVEQPEVVEMPDHRPAVARLDVGPLGAGLGGMGREEAAAAPPPAARPPAGPPARPCRRRAESMPGSTSSAPANSSKNASASASRSGTRRPSTPGPSKKMPPGGDAQPDRPRRGHGLARVPEHVHHRGDPAEQPARRSRASPRAAPCRGSGSRPRPSRPAGATAPAADPRPARGTGCRRMAMGVDQPRHQEHAARVDRPRAPSVADRRRRPDPGDAPVRHRDRAVADHGAGGIGRDDEGVGDDEIGCQAALGSGALSGTPPPAAVNAERRRLPGARSAGRADGPARRPLPAKAARPPPAAPPPHRPATCAGACRGRPR